MYTPSSNPPQDSLVSLNQTPVLIISSDREYAPKFALRSYFYLLPSVSAARASEMFLSLFGQGNDKPQVSLPSQACGTRTARFR